MDDASTKVVLRCSPSLLPLVVDEINTFASSRGTDLNPKKCKEMLISFLKYNIANINLIYTFGSFIVTVSSFKIPGPTLLNDLSWNLYIDNVIRKANSRLYALRLLKRDGLRQSVMVEMYYLFIRSSVEYAAPAWTNLTVNLSDHIENMQKRALRIIYPAMSYDHALSHSSLEPLARRRINLSQSFIAKLKSIPSTRNHVLSQIINNRPQVNDKKYNL